MFPFVKIIIKFGYFFDLKIIKKAVSVELKPTFVDKVPHNYLTKPNIGQIKSVENQLKYLDKNLNHRLSCAKIYYEHLKDIHNVLIPDFKEDRTHSYLYYPICVEDKFNLQYRLIMKGFDVAVQHAPNCSDLEEFKDFKVKCIKARKLETGTVTLPTYPGYPLKDVEKLALEIRKFYGLSI